MDRTQISSHLLEYFQGLAPDPTLKLTPSTRLLEDWFLDSLGILETVIFLEKQFGVAMQRADINPATFESVDTLTELIVTRTGR